MWKFHTEECFSILLSVLADGQISVIQYITLGLKSSVTSLGREESFLS